MFLKRSISLIVACTLSVSMWAKEYENLVQYRAKTGKEVLSRKDWTTKDRKNNTRQWQEACLYNFSYAGGAKEFKSFEERTYFYNWVSEYLNGRGHEVEYPKAQYELSRYLKKTQKAAFDKDIRLFCKAVHTVVFDTAFTLLQELKNMSKPLTGMEADQWDKEMFFFEHTEIYQPLIMKMDAESISKFNRIMNRKGLAFLSLPIELKLKGKVENVNDRITWAEKKLLPFASGESLTPKEIKSKEKVSKKEKKIKKEKRNEDKAPSKPVIVTEP